MRSAERDQIAKEREESAAMLRELQALRNQLAQQNTDASTDVAASESQPTDNDSQG